MIFFKHVYWAIRFGKWDYGCEFWERKPMLGVFYTYYDGNWFSAHLGPLWVSCEY